MDARPLLLGAVFIVGTAVGTNACLRTTQFECQNSDQCGAAGTCEAVGFCSFADSSCPGGQRFGDSAGPLANTCVGGGDGNDAGVDAPPDDGAPPDMPPGGCPGDFAPLTGQPANHKYKLVAAPTQNWNTAHNDCVSQGGYLAIPDDAAELLAFEMLTTAQHWIGVSDIFGGTADDEVFINVKNMPAFTLFDTANGEPSDGAGANDQDCVATDNQLMSTERCGATKLPYVCECEE